MDAQTSLKRVKGRHELDPSSTELAKGSSLLNRLLRLPAEVFAEICSFLSAIDLLHLALVDEAVWSLLAADEAGFIWNRAFRKITPPVPECPRTMRAPNYVRLLLVEACTACGTTTGDLDLDPFNRVRYCKSCYSSNMITEAQVFRLRHDFPREFLDHLAVDADYSLSDGRKWKASKQKYYKSTVVEVYDLWQSYSNAQGMGRDLATVKVQALLDSYSNDRFHTGWKILNWVIEYKAHQASIIAEMKRERRATISQRLFALGYDEMEIPRSNHPIIDKADVLTEEEWSQISTRLQYDAIETGSIWGQRWIGRSSAGQDLDQMWKDVIKEVLGKRAVYYTEGSALPWSYKLLNLPEVVAVVGSSPEDVSREQLDLVRPHAFKFALETRRRALVRRRNVLRRLPADQFDEHEWLGLTDEETITKLNDIAAEVALAINGIWDLRGGMVNWSPSWCLAQPLPDSSCELTVLEDVAPGLVERLLKDLGADVDMMAGYMVCKVWGMGPGIVYRCTRCDERIVSYMMFDELINHYVRRKLWFDKALLAQETANARQDKSETSPHHSVLVNDHDWYSDAQLAVKDSAREMTRIKQSRKTFKQTYGKDLEDVAEGGTSTGKKKKTRSIERTQRICRLCPEGFSPPPMYFAAMKIHIERLHQKQVVDLAADTAAFDPDRDTPPENPCDRSLKFLLDP